MFTEKEHLHIFNYHFEVCMKKNCSDIEKWLRKNFMSTVDFSVLVGCSRQVIWKMKQGKPVMPKFAKRVLEITEGEVVVKEFPKGRNWRRLKDKNDNAQVRNKKKRADSVQKKENSPGNTPQSSKKDVNS